jgi:hypothetical protein
MAAAVLVPVSQIIGFNKKLPAQYKLLQPPAASHRVMFAFSGNKTLPAPHGLLPVELAAAVLQWSVLASSRVHVATFSSRPAMQQAMALLANATGLKYAVADFRLLQDSTVSTVIDPGQLFDLSRLPIRQLLQQQQQQQPQQQTHSNRAAESAEAFTHGAGSSSYRAAQASKLLATHRHRLALRKAKRRQLLLEQPALASIGLPATARGLLEQQQQHWVHDVAQSQQQAPAAWPLQRSRVTAGAGEDGTSSQQQQPEAVLAGSTICAEHGLQDNEMGAHSYSSSWANSYACGSGTAAAVAARRSVTAASRAGNAAERQHHQQRRLQQLPTLPAAAIPQPQQTQAKQHVQKGGQGVAWHLTASGLDVKPAWNKTYGKWCTAALYMNVSHMYSLSSVIMPANKSAHTSNSVHLPDLACAALSQVSSWTNCKHLHSMSVAALLVMRTLQDLMKWWWQ